jgi:hypothetical protein
MEPAEPPDRAATATWGRRTTYLIVVLTVGQLLVATFASSLPQFTGKAFGARLVLYPVTMLAPVVAWTLVARRRRAHGGTPGPTPWPAFACIAAPFLIDVSGNSLDLYDTIGWWDDANHLVNWLLLSLGVGLLLVRAEVRPRWALPLLVTGIGALLAIGWELAEWFTFIRHGTELATAYTDTLGDLALGTLGSAVAAVLLARRRDR